MRYIFEFCIIAAISFAAEVIKYFLPLPVPASIYGLIIMLILLISGVLKVEKVSAVADFLIKIMPLMFIPAVVGLVESYTAIKPIVIRLIIFVPVSTVVVMGVCGSVAQAIRTRQKRQGVDIDE